MMEKETHLNCITQRAVSKKGGGVWTLQNEIQIDKKIKSIAKFVYKSSFIPNENKILLSFRDKSDRYRLAQIEFECKKNARSTDK